ncbi:S8 family serine peptidase [Kitasatospora sp. NPDC048540]|uniref:S8 family peptidase n=1 Tax=Kitasatospora sp. NPDC048540 TaxID=3155634 RepID=UPI0033CF3933
MALPLRHSSHRALAALAVTAALALGAAQPATAAAPPEGVVAGADSPGAVPGSYLVILRPTLAKATASAGATLAHRYGGTLRRTFGAALNGYSVQLSDRQARRLAADPAVAEVVQNHRVAADTTRTGLPSWGLDRIDQKRLPLDDRLTTVDSGGQGVTAYVIDTGVLVTHDEFGGRASSGYDAVDLDGDADDGNGHGTHVAATIAGSSFGVAPKAAVVAVRVLDDDGSGTTEQVVDGIDWVTRNAHKPAVANLSLGSDPDDALDAAVRNSIASGITYAAAAGNQGVDASEHSPARVQTAITVGATDRDDHRAWYSNYGPLVDLFAPGSDITSAWIGWDESENTISGTSMATPHVTGAAALYLAGHRTATPAQVAAALTGAASPGSVQQDPGDDTTDRLLYVGTTPIPPLGKRFDNTTPVTVDNNTAESPITVTGVPGRAPAMLDVHVSVTHYWPADLTADLIAPDGRSYRVMTASDDLLPSPYHVLIGVNASASPANGVWRLRVYDPAESFGGQLDGWALQF